MSYGDSRNGPAAAECRQSWLARIMASAEALHRIQFDAPWRRRQDCCRG